MFDTIVHVLRVVKREQHDYCRKKVNLNCEQRTWTECSVENRETTKMKAIWIILLDISCSKMNKCSYSNPLFAGKMFIVHCSGFCTIQLHTEAFWYAQWCCSCPLDRRQTSSYMWVRFPRRATLFRYIVKLHTVVAHMITKRSIQYMMNHDANQTLSFVIHFTCIQSVHCVLKVKMFQKVFHNLPTAVYPSRHYINPDQVRRSMIYSSQDC